jgi:hypothetical protein
MTIVEALKDKENNLRVSTTDKTLFYDSIADAWIVKKNKHRRLSTGIIIETNDEELAIEKLLED